MVYGPYRQIAEGNENHLRQPFFFGEYELSVDTSKNRMLLPAEIRRQIDPENDGEAFFLVKGSDGRPWMYTEKYFKFLVSQEPSELTPTQDAIDYIRNNVGRASRLEWDAQGRVLFPERVLKRAGIGKEVTLVGAQDHLELWDRSEWEAECARLDARRSEIDLKRRQLRQPPPT